jgi:hypothetical protein
MLERRAYSVGLGRNRRGCPFASERETRLRNGHEKCRDFSCPGFSPRRSGPARQDVVVRSRATSGNWALTLKSGVGDPGPRPRRPHGEVLMPVARHLRVQESGFAASPSFEAGCSPGPCWMRGEKGSSQLSPHSGKGSCPFNPHLPKF